MSAPKSGFADVRCSRCSARRIVRADGSPGACSLIGCKEPLHDVRAESEGGTWKTRAEKAEAELRTSNEYRDRYADLVAKVDAILGWTEGVTTVDDASETRTVCRAAEVMRERLAIQARATQAEAQAAAMVDRANRWLEQGCQTDRCYCCDAIATAGALPDEDDLTDAGRTLLAEVEALREVAAKATAFMQQVHRLPTGDAYERARGDLFVAFCKLERERGDHG